MTLRYVDDDGHPTLRYPMNPNGSVDAIAGLCSSDGRHLVSFFFSIFLISLRKVLTRAKASETVIVIVANVYSSVVKLYAPRIKSGPSGKTRL